METRHNLTENPDLGLIKSLDIRGNPHGPLAGLNVVVKDLFDIAGEVTAFGNPDWGRHFGAALSHAWIVSQLLESGARITGKTTTVELAFGLEGRNAHYGTPINPAAPDRLPGGSSSGSAAMIAGGHAHVGIGSDTGGSVRIPASYCGLYGLRPSQGLLSLAGAAALAPSFDTPGWFARDAETMLRVGEALLPPAPPLSAQFLRIPAAFANADPGVVAALAPALDRLGPTAEIDPVPEGLDRLLALQNAVRGRETWLTLGGFIDKVNPTLDPVTAGRIAATRGFTTEAAAEGKAARLAYTARMHALLAGGAVLVIPTSPCPAPPVAAEQSVYEDVRTRTLRVGIIAAFAGLPELTIPVGKVGGAPVGLSLIAGPGRDLALLELAADLALA
ncbi:MAG TPA: amidase [Acidiphilium sp.]|uniref:amidase n=1 Tax=unclassified Acidiphilium TaxID=2617493 RepID=UPI000BC9243F|nr:MULTISPECIES: amidase [unclassified Acidiphilium]OYV55610.1 MAG: amidase [Acidiphilium sp. 20-67-58]HQT60198.1 amidase [Acidiphilium sp.]HQU10814.1 amidase [Acidiphilium sp.]